MFVVFTAATCASIPTSLAGVAAAVVAAASTAVLAVVLGAAESSVGRMRSAAAPTDTPAPNPFPRRRHRLQAIRCCVAVGVAGAVSTGTGIGHSYWAMVACVVPLSVPRLGNQLARGVNRLAGTAVGLVLAAGLLAVPLPSAVVVLVVVTLQAVAELLVARHYGAALVFITPLALLVGRY